MEEMHRELPESDETDSTTRVDWNFLRNLNGQVYFLNLEQIELILFKLYLKSVLKYSLVLCIPDESLCKSICFLLHHQKLNLKEKYCIL